MGKGISIGIAADTKPALTAIKTGLIDPLEDAADALKKVAKEGNDLDTIESGMKGSQRATNQFDKELQDAVDSIRKVSSTAKQSTREVSDDFEISAGQQAKIRKKALSEIKSEAKANAAETFSSFDGSAASFADGIQGTLGGLVSSLGPVGLAVGAAGALAIGYINGALQKADTTSAEFKQGVADLTAELIQSGEVGTASLGYIIDRLKKLAAETDGSKDNLGKLKKTADASGSSFKDLAQAYAGNEKGLQKVIAAGKAHLADLEAQKAAVLNSMDTDKSAAVELQKKIAAQTDYNNGLTTAKTKADEAATATANYAKAGGPEMERKAALIDQVNSSYDDAAGAVEDYVNKESGLFDVEAYLAAIDKRTKALHDYQANLAAAKLDPRAVDFLNAQGAEAAATLMDAYVHSSDAQRGKLAAAWTEAGKTSSGSYTAALKGALPTAIPGPTVTPSANLGPLNSQLNKWLSQPVQQKVVVNAFTPAGKRIY